MGPMDGPDLAVRATLAVVHAGIDFHIPQFTPEEWLQLIILVIALILCAFASAAETALTSVSRIKLKNMVEEGDKKAQEIERLLAEPNTFLSTILIVNSVAVIVASSMATVLALNFSQTFGELIATVLISLVVLIFCEITPKTVAVQNGLRWSRALVGPVQRTAWLLRPLVRVLSVITNSLARLVGGEIRHRGPFVTEEELRLLVTVGEKEGILEEEETEMINSIFEFADTTAREVMIPRIDMVTLESNATVDEAVDVALQGGLSRIPVYEGTIDNIIGVLYTKDMLKQLREHHHNMPVRDLVRPAFFVPETKKLDDLLHEMRRERKHIVIVVDEYGSVAGLVTIEDLVEEIVGDIKDEYDLEESVYERVNEDTFVFDARISIHDFNDIMDTHLDDEDYDTLGGFVYAKLDKIPVMGDSVTFEDMTFTVLTTRGRRIMKVRVERTPKRPETQPEQVEGQSAPLLLPPATERKEGEGTQQGESETPSEHPSHYGYRGA